MAKSPYSRASIESLVRLIEDRLEAGDKPPGAHGPGRSAIEAAADVLAEAGVKYGHAGIRRRLEEGGKHGIVVDWTRYIPKQYKRPGRIHPDPVPHTYNNGGNIPTGEIVTVAVIPDVHVSPSLSNERLSWIGRWANEVEPDYVVQLGDFLTLDSMSAHDKPGSINHKIQPTFQSDLAHGVDAIGLFNEWFADKATKKIITLGNHEYRANRFEDTEHRLEGTITSAVEGIFKEGGFRTSPYGEFVFIEGVGFIHHVNNSIGRAYGGKTAPQRIAADSVFSIVHGHTHQKHSVGAAKVGPSAEVRTISAGCALPHGHIEDYAVHSTTGWSWGVLKITICQGQILDEDWTSMFTLERRYAGSRKHG